MVYALPTTTFVDRRVFIHNIRRRTRCYLLLFAVDKTHRPIQTISNVFIQLMTRHYNAIHRVVCLILLTVIVFTEQSMLIVY